MQFHHHIIHHVRKHTANIVAHVNKHHKKYIVGAGILGGALAFKLIGIIVIFFGATYLGGGTSLGGDYYDAEYYLLQETAGKQISISNDITSNATGCAVTGDNLSLTTGDCPKIY